MKKKIMFLFVLVVTVVSGELNVKADVLCKRATELHTEICNNDSEYGSCSKDGYSVGSTIAYGSLGTSGVLTTGDAFDCDVNNDGVYNAENERFYYLKALEGDANTAILMYYSNTDSSGNPTISPSAKFMANNLGTNLSGPSGAVTYLPDTTKWPAVKLTTETRQIYNELGGTTSAAGNLSTLYYGSKAASRLVTYKEIYDACYDGTTSITINGGLVNKCGFLSERLVYASGNSDTTAQWYWTETVDSVGTYGGYGVVDSRVATTYGGGDTSYSIRPLIEVSMDRIEITPVSNDKEEIVIEPDTENKSSSNQVVDVEDTAWNVSKLGIYMGLAILVVGAVLIVQTYTRNKKVKDSE